MRNQKNSQGLFFMAPIVALLFFEPAFSDSYILSVSAEPIAAHKVKFVLTTNIPLPVEVMVGVDLKGQKPKDVYIGHSERVKLHSSPQTFMLDATIKNLPAGNYIAIATFYPRWGAKSGNPDALRVQEKVEGSMEVILTGSGESAKVAAERENLQKWLMLTVASGMRWDEQMFVKKLGGYETISADRRIHTGFYFPKADMTILVNTYRGTISTWRMGQASK